MRRSFACVLRLVAVRGLAATTILGAGSAALAQDVRTSEQLLADFLHYTIINRDDAAIGFGRELLARGLSPVEFVVLVENSRDGADRFSDTIGLAMRRPGLEPTAASMMSLFQRGKLERVRDPKEIARNISLLTGTQRGRLLARERLVQAGEYALPQLFTGLLQRSDPTLRAEVHRLLVDMGRQSVTPLASTLSLLDPSSQEVVIDVLGQIEYRTSVPYIVEIRETTTTQRVREAANRALLRLMSNQTLSVGSGELFRQLGEGYYEERAELTSFPGEDTQLLWTYDPSAGLHMTAIASEVFHEAMAMRCAERSMVSGASEDVMALWVASNFSREIDSKSGYENPAYPRSRRTADYYAVAAGTAVSQKVLARALDSRDTPLARRAIASIDLTAGGATLWSGEGRKPLLEALQYPSRRVQYEAALALGKAEPSAAFTGSERVVPIIASAVRDASDRYAAVIAADVEGYQVVRGVLEGQGYKVLPHGRRLADLDEAIQAVPGVDLVVTRLPGESTRTVIESARGSNRLGVTPILSLASAQGYVELRRQFERDVSVQVRQEGISENELAEAARQLVEAASGAPMSVPEATIYASRALRVLRDLAVGANPVLDAGDAAGPLIAVLARGDSPLRMDVGDVLARVGQKRAQVALMDAAMASSGRERVAFMARVSESAKRFGNLLEASQIDRVVELARNGSEEEATAAAALLGSLNIENSRLVELILEQR